MKVLVPLLSCALAISVSAACAQRTISPPLTARDVVTADGSCRVGLHGDNVYCVLTAIETRVELSPDSWSSDGESKNWTNWLSEFDNNLYSNWLKNASVNGQETVAVRIADGNISSTNGTFLQTTYATQQALGNEKSKFEQSINNALEQTLKTAPPIPQTKNKLKEIRTKLTFMRDSNVVPRVGKNDFGFAAVRGVDGKLVVYGRTDDTGRAPGIQILSDNDGGSIQILDQGSFVQKCSEIDKLQ